MKRNSKGQFASTIPTSLNSQPFLQSQNYQDIQVFINYLFIFIRLIPWILLLSITYSYMNVKKILADVMVSYACGENHSCCINDRKNGF